MTSSGVPTWLFASTSHSASVPPDKAAAGACDLQTLGGPAHRLGAVVGDEHGARCQHARRFARWAERRNRRPGSGPGSRRSSCRAARRGAAGCGRAAGRRRRRLRCGRPRRRRWPARRARRGWGRRGRGGRRRRGSRRARPGAGSSRLSLIRRWRAAGSSAKAWKAERLPPGPTPISRRPLESMSSTEASSATRSGHLERQGDDAGGQADALGARGGVREEDQRRGQTAFVAHGNGVARPRRCRSRGGRHGRSARCRADIVPAARRGRARGRRSQAEVGSWGRGLR